MSDDIQNLAPLEGQARFFYKDIFPADGDDLLIEFLVDVLGHCFLIAHVSVCGYILLRNF